MKQSFKNLLLGGLLLGGLLLGCGSPWDELFGRTPGVLLTVYRATPSTTERGTLLAVEASFASRSMDGQPDCVRLSAQVGSVEATAATGTTTTREVFLPLSSALPHRALAVYRQSATAAGKPDVVIAELLPSAACHGETGMVPVARAVLSIDSTNNQTSESLLSDMAVKDLGQVRD